MWYKFMKLALPFAGSIFSRLGGNQVKYVDNPATMKQLAQTRAKLEQLNSKFNKQLNDLKAMEAKLRKSTNPESYLESSNKLFDTFIDKLKVFQLQLPQGVDLSKKHIAFIGKISAGKSSVINALAKKKLCKVGMGETTMSPTPVMTTQNSIVVWDFPGEKMGSYYNLEVLAFMKIVHRVVIIYDNDPADLERVIRICHAFKRKMIFVRNKCDNADEDEDYRVWLKKDKDKIKQMIPGLQKVDDVYGLAAKNVYLNATKHNTNLPVFDWNQFNLALIK